MYKKIITIVISACVLVCLRVHSVHAAQLIVASQYDTVDQQQEFYVDVLLDPQGVTLNGIEGAIQFSADTLELERIEDANSVIGPWIQAPDIEPGKVTFAGIMPNGFSGLIDPFDSNKKQPGKLFRLIFSARASGGATILSSGVISTLNDGNGTEVPLANTNISITIGNKINPSHYAVSDRVRPVLTANVVQDSLLYNGRYALIFNALDKESGIDRVEVQEGTDAPVVATSPYLLKDQTRNSIIIVHAYDHAGNVTTVIIAPTYTTQSIGYILIALIALIVLLIILHDIRRRRKTKNI